MKKALLIFLLTFVVQVSFSQYYSRLGWTNEAIFQYEEMRYEQKSGGISNPIGLKFHNVNCRFGGSLLGTLIFGYETKFFIGEYFDLGIGVGIGKKSGGTIYDGTTFNMLLGGNLGFVTCYNINDDLTVGLKTILWGGDNYLDFDQNVSFYNGRSFYPTVRLGQFQTSLGFGGRNQVKPVKKVPFIDAMLRYNFSEDPDDSWYLGLKYRRSNHTYLDNDTKEHIGSFMIEVGYFW